MQGDDKDSAEEAPDGEQATALPSRQTLVAINFVADAGRQMLESSSSVAEVQSRLRRFLPVVGLEGCSLDATMSSLILSYSTPGQQMPITAMRDLNVSNPRLERLTETQMLLDRVEAGELDVSAAASQLEELTARPMRPTKWTLSAVLVSVAGWVLFQDGLTVLTVVVGLLATAVTLPVEAIVRRVRLPALFGTFLVAVIVAAVPNLLAAAGVPLRVGPAVVGALFIYLPGRAFVSSVIDGISNAPISSLSRGIQALVTAGALAIGMLVGSRVGTGLGVDYQPDLAATQLAWSFVGAALGIFGLSVAWSMPRPRILPTVLIGTAGWILVALTTSPDGDFKWLWYGLAAAGVGMAGTAAATRQGGSASVYIGVAILPLVPGFLLYAGMLAVADGQGSAAASALREAGIISLSIAIGAAMGLALSRDLLSGITRLRSSLKTESRDS